MRLPMQDEEKIIARILNIFMGFALAGSVAILIYAGIFSGGVFTSLLLSGLVGTITCLIVLWLLHNEHFFVPKILLPLVTYLLATYLIFTGATVSVRDDAILLYSLVVALAGLLLRKRGVLVFGVLSLLMVELSVFAVIAGWIGDPLTRNSISYGTLITVGVIYFLTFSMMYILVDILTNNLQRVTTSQQALSTVNHELMAVRESLEQQVKERTRVAELDRLEAEKARAEAEAQVWFARGHAHLAELMRGEMDMAALANNITSFISKYIEAQTGALFVRSGDRLVLTGCYAYIEQAGQKKEFAMGEGLIGESAQSKLMIFLDDFPGDVLVVASALGEARPRKIVIVPLESNGQVLGVLEFATLNHFKPEFETLLKRMAESIAIGLRTVQTRVQMSELLERSQKQAKELQDRFEH